MINEMATEMTSELILEMIPELTGDPAEIGDPDGCPLTRTLTYIHQPLKWYITYDIKSNK